jgi:rhodanese-related sulfurtransferase
MNKRLDMVNGSLTLCGVDDFRDTLKKEHTVVTLCRYKPKWTSTDSNERHHYYFRAKNSTPEIWAHAVDLVIDLLDTGKDVLLHCVHGRDRTGGVAYVVLRLLANLNDKEVRAKMAELRPSMAIPWKDILPKNKELYDSIARELIHNMIHENKNKNKTERNDI